MLAAYLISGKMPQPSWIQILYYSFAASVLALGLGYLTSAVNVFFKDMQQIVGIMLQFGIWMCPIMYDETLFTSRAPWVGTVLKLNPFYYIVAGYRDSMLTGDPFWMRPTLSIYFWAVTLIIFFMGLGFFKRVRPHFSDVL
jgi:teichoic acid transport system permease protein